MDINDIYSGKFLKVADLKGRHVTVTIATVGEAEFKDEGGQKKRQITIGFNGTDKILGLNKTNALRVAALCNSTRTESWIGHRIRLVPATTEFAGREVDCIRIDKTFHEAPAGNGGTRAAMQAQAPLRQEQITMVGPPPKQPEPQPALTEEDWAEDPFEGVKADKDPNFLGDDPIPF